jgi:dUTP pyrophosphatase
MKFVALHPNFKLPTRGSDEAAGYDISMPEAGEYQGVNAVKVPLGFAAAVPYGYVALIVPRSGVGFKKGVEVNNTVGVIDSDYRGEWFASIRTKGAMAFKWEAGEKLLQFIIVKHEVVEPELVSELPPTGRGTGGLGSTGK